MAWRAVRSLEALAAEGDGRVRHVHSLGRETVGLTPLRCGAAMLAHMAVRETTGAGDWRGTAYRSVSPALFVVEDGVVHGSAGVISAGDAVVAETLDHADPARIGFSRREGAIGLADGEIEALDGVALCLVSGGCESHYHWLIDAVGRLGVVPAGYREADWLLISDDVAPGSRRLLERLALPGRARVRAMRDGDRVRARSLVKPGSVSGDSRHHPCVAAAFAGLGGARGGGWPRRFYVDRRQSASRRLINEPALIERLAGMGVPAIAVERLGVDEQMALFGSAELIVAPHGAGLANMVFAPAGCRVVELLMDSYVNWCFRNLAGVCRLEYDCLIGRTVGDWPPLSPAVHGASWAISVDHVAAAIS